MARGDLSGLDRRLGLGEKITRRDFIGSTLFGAGATLLSGCAPLATPPQTGSARALHPWDGYGGVGDYATSNGDTQAVMDAAHVLRDGTQGRAQLLGKSYLDYEREIRAHMNDAFGAGGFDARRDIAGIILNRWGHAYIGPQPGFYFGGKNGEGLTAPMKKGHGRIFYGHSELGWRMNYRNAIAEGGRGAFLTRQPAKPMPIKASSVCSPAIGPTVLLQTWPAVTAPPIGTGLVVLVHNFLKCF